LKIGRWLEETTKMGGVVTMEDWRKIKWMRCEIVLYMFGAKLQEGNLWGCHVDNTSLLCKELG